MYQLQEESLRRFIVRTQKILEGLRSGPFWMLMANEPNFKEWMEDFEAISKQVASQ
jgi:hypothetical protein